MALPADFKAKADALMAQSYAADGPGASVVISEGGKIVYQSQRGLADIATKRPIIAATVFRIGSITKQFSAAVVLQLAAEGKLELSDPISKFLPDYPQPGGSATVAQLLNHTVGIQPYTAIPGFMDEASTNRPYTTEQLIAVFKDKPAPSKPGEKFEYNNSGYILVGALIERITGNSWSAEVERRISRPLGLATIVDGVGEAKLAAMATGYTGGEKGPGLAKKIHMSVPGAGGALLGNAEDLAKWGHALHHGKVVPQPYYAQMIAPTKLADGSDTPYGYGLFPGKLRGVDAVGHGGGIFGFSTDSLYVPANDLFVVILTNSDQPKADPGMVMRKLSAMAIGKPYESFATVALDKASVEPLLGVYKFEGAERTFAMADGKLTMQRDGNPALEVHAAGANRFHYGADSLTWFAIRRDGAGGPVIEFRVDGEEAVLGHWSGPVPVVVAVAVPHDTLASYAGTYSTPIGKAVIALGVGDKMTVQLSGQPALGLKALSRTSFLVDKVGAKVAFVAAGGKITGLEIEQGGKKLPGTRD
ncbi:MAG: beta-lactamase family protein [Pseudomonadota bacterium]|nr:beta-lactamase family protein [Pseudomonadota bacterium]